MSRRRPRTRNVGLIRLLRMERFLRRRRAGVTVSQLARRYLVHRRTIWRDLNVLADAGARVQRLRSGAGGETLVRVRRGARNDE